jgi:hypothetical protein
MNTYLAAAAALTFLIGTGHSVIGERMIFKHLRTTGIVPTLPAAPLKARHVYILWGSWHIVTVMAFAFAAQLLKLAMATIDTDFPAFALQTIVISMLLSSLLVLLATKGKHPAWLALLGVVVLIWLR